MSPNQEDNIASEKNWYRYTAGQLISQNNMKENRVNNLFGGSVYMWLWSVWDWLLGRIQTQSIEDFIAKSPTFYKDTIVNAYNTSCNKLFLEFDLPLQRAFGNSEENASSGHTPITAFLEKDFCVVAGKVQEVKMRLSTMTSTRRTFIASGFLTGGKVNDMQGLIRLLVKDVLKMIGLEKETYIIFQLTSVVIGIGTDMTFG
jgi:hypothetical protein